MIKLLDTTALVCLFLLSGACRPAPVTPPPACFVEPGSNEDGITLLREPYDLLHSACGQDPALALQLLERRRKYFTCNDVVDLRWRILYAEALCRTHNYTGFLEVMNEMYRNGGNEQEHANAIMAYCSVGAPTACDAAAPERKRRNTALQGDTPPAEPAEPAAADASTDGPNAVCVEPNSSEPPTPCPPQ